MITRLTYWSLYDVCLKRIAAYLEMDSDQLDRMVCTYCTRTGCDAHEGLRHHLTTKRADGIFAWMGPDEGVTVEAFEVQYRQQLVEVATRRVRVGYRLEQELPPD